MQSFTCNYLIHINLNFRLFLIAWKRKCILKWIRRWFWPEMLNVTKWFFIVDFNQKLGFLDQKLLFNWNCMEVSSRHIRFTCPVCIKLLFQVCEDSKFRPWRQKKEKKFKFELEKSRWTHLNEDDEQWVIKVRWIRS